VLRLLAQSSDETLNFDGAPDLEFRLASKALELEQSGLSARAWRERKAQDDSRPAVPAFRRRRSPPSSVAP
jgi:hypothetical protein